MGDIVIVGAGIGGLCAARAVTLAGHRPVLIERSADTATGAGLVLWPNAVRALGELGCGQRIRVAAMTARRMVIRSAAGPTLSEFDASQFSRTAEAPMLLIGRPELHRVLAASLAPPRIGTVTAADEHGVTLDGGERVDGDAVIGADGLGSVVRRLVAPEARVVDSGYTAIRAVADYALPDGMALEVWGHGELAGAAALPGGRSYWFYETATERFDPADPLAALDASRWPGPVPALAAATAGSALLINTIRTVTPLPSWTRGRVAVLGDAAHAMAPNLGQGGAQAIEDAAALLTALRGQQGGQDDLAAALASYAAGRRPRATMVQRESARLARLALTRHGQARDLLVRIFPERVRAIAINRLITPGPAQPPGPPPG